MSDTDSSTITLPMIYTAVLDFRGEVLEHLEKQRHELAEGQSLLFQRTELHRQRIEEFNAKLDDFEQDADEHAEWIASLRKRYHRLANKVQQLILDLQDMRKVLAQNGIEARDTEQAPPPVEEPSSNDDDPDRG